jgi:uncharacterized protein YpbB
VESTVTKYLVEHILEGSVEDVSAWVSESEIQRVIAAANKVGYGRLIPIYEACNSQIDYNKIKIALAFQPALSPSGQPKGS